MLGRIREQPGGLFAILGAIVIAASPCSYADESAERPSEVPLNDSSAALRVIDWQTIPATVASEEVRLFGPLAFDGRDGVRDLFDVRQLSLITLAESNDARLFLGINREGILGLHFGALSPASRARTVELMRLPHLREYDPGND